MTDGTPSVVAQSGPKRTLPADRGHERPLPGSSRWRPENGSLELIRLDDANHRQVTAAAAIRDHHGRALAFGAKHAHGGRILIARECGQVVGWIRTELEALLLYRDDSFSELFSLGAVIEQPVMAAWRPEICELLMTAALADLEALGAKRVQTYVPLDAGSATALLENLGFRTDGFCDEAASLMRYGWTARCRLMSRELQPLAARRSVLPRLIQGPTRSNANAADAPEPSLDFWGRTTLYSCFSGYAHTPDYLRGLLRPSDRSLLSAPCAGGDFLRLVPEGLVPRRVGLDLSGRACRLARLRLDHPLVDELNARLVRSFRQQAVGIRHPDALRDELSDLFESLGQERRRDERVEQLRLDMTAAFERLVESPAIPDWLILLKVLALSLAAETDDIEGSLRTLAERTGPIEDFLAARNHDRVFPELPPSAATRLLTGDLRQSLDLGERFDVIVVWEALLMFASFGLEAAMLENLLHHLEPGGRLILTGLRSPLGAHPPELTRAQAFLETRGLECHLTFQVVPPPAWLPHSLELTLPTLTAWKLS